MTNKSMINIDGKFSLRSPKRKHGDLIQIFPYKRSIVGTLSLGGMLAAFTAPFFSIDNLMFAGPPGELFSVVTFLFSAFWLLGWSFAVAMLAMLFLGSILGQEQLILSDRKLLLRLEIFGAGFTRSFDGGRIDNLRREDPEPGTSVAWRGPHMCFEYDDETVNFGCNVDRRTAELTVSDVIEKVLVPAAASPTSEPTPELERQPPGKAEKAEHIAPATTNNGSGEQSMSASGTALLLANAIPLLGVLFFNWSVGDVMLVYWAESAVVGIYNIAKMWIIGRWAALFVGIFFIAHYGAFMVGHLFFIYAFMIRDPESTGGIPMTEVTADLVALLPALIALFVSHGISFYQNFLGHREYEGKNMNRQMGEPYKRIVLMHITIIFGAFLVMAFDNAVPVLILMIALKIGADFRAHLSEHKLHKLGHPT